jgi:hypothetical protein
MVEEVEAVELFENSTVATKELQQTLNVFHELAQDVFRQAVEQWLHRCCCCVGVDIDDEDSNCGKNTTSSNNKTASRKRKAEEDGTVTATEPTLALSSQSLPLLLLEEALLGLDWLRLLTEHNKYIINSTSRRNRTSSLNAAVKTETESPSSSKLSNTKRTAEHATALDELLTTILQAQGDTHGVSVSSSASSSVSVIVVLVLVEVLSGPVMTSGFLPSDSPAVHVVKRHISYGYAGLTIPAPPAVQQPLLSYQNENDAMSTPTTLSLSNQLSQTFAWSFDLNIDHTMSTRNGNMSMKKMKATIKKFQYDRARAFLNVVMWLCRQPPNSNRYALSTQMVRTIILILDQQWSGVDDDDNDDDDDDDEDADADDRDHYHRARPSHSHNNIEARWKIWTYMDNDNDNSTSISGTILAQLIGGGGGGRVSNHGTATSPTPC